MGTSLRRLILLLLLFGLVGTASELVLLEHFEDWKQKIPLGMLGLGALTALFVLARPSRPAVRFFRLTMFGFVAAGSAGLYYHYTGNVEFELEMRPTMHGLELVRESLKGATPALAPGTMIQFGLLGLLYTFRHPLLSRDRVAVTDPHAD